MIDITALASSSKGNCYRVTDGVTPLLLECGISWKEIQRGLEFKTSEIQGCLITHEHKDHCKAINDITKAGIDCYASLGTIKTLRATGHRIKEIRAKEQFKIGSWIILPFEAQHDAADPVGFLLQNKAGGKLLYATDTYYLKYRFKGLTHIMIECNHASDILKNNVEAGMVPMELKNRLMKSHFNLDNVKNFLRANDLTKVQEIWLIHLSDVNSDTERFKREIQGLTGKVVYVAGEKGG